MMQLLIPLDDSLFPAKTASYSGTAGSTGTWDAGVQALLVWTTSDAYVTIGNGVTATTSSTPIPANVPIPFSVPQGTGSPWRVSAIQVSSSGTLYAKPISGN
jgi:hypothetical protein